ncbi:MAG: SH3 domain-containing protein, partial [Desulfobulbaceae bacterium]|nr:SH3 domain-containing protein [Desulfobulbaceae bacterium]
MPRILASSLLALLFCLFPAGQVSAETLYVSSSGATLKSAASASSPTVAELPLGANLTVVEKGQRWHKVRTASGQEGWIYRGKVSPEKPKTTETAGAKGSAGDLLGGLTG